MWSSDRRKVLAFVCATAALSACGFEPVHAPGGGGAALLGQVQAAAPETTDDYVLVREIETRLGRSASPRLILDYVTRVDEERMAISSTNITTRFNVIGSITYELKDAGSDIVLRKGKVDSFTSYSATGSTVATQSARSDARERLMIILADLMLTRLYADAADLPL